MTKIFRLLASTLMLFAVVAILPACSDEKSDKKSDDKTSGFSFNDNKSLSISERYIKLYEWAAEEAEGIEDREDLHDLYYYTKACEMRIKADAIEQDYDCSEVEWRYINNAEQDYYKELEYSCREADIKPEEILNSYDRRDIHKESYEETASCEEVVCY